VTLVVGLVAGSMVLHVGDRLLTDKGAEWDQYANKSVVVLGSDGWATVSYSGLAHIGGRPTDQWLAEVLSGQKPGPGSHGGLGTTFSNVIPTLGPALARLPDAIEQDFGREPPNGRARGMRILVSGFVTRRRRSPLVRPFGITHKHSGQAGASVETIATPRTWRWQDHALPGSIGRPPDEGWDHLIAALERPGHNLDSIERIMVDQIRTVAAIPGSVVGPNCMSIALSAQRDVRIRFLPAPTHAVSAISFTPWIVAPRLLQPPQELGGTGGWQLHHRPYSIQIDRQPPLPPSPRITMRGQRRKPLK
jgi:hypothetical protein